jgi:hypothetical protein
MAQVTSGTATPNGGFVSFTLAAGASSAPIALPLNTPWHVTGTVTTNSDQGIGEVEMIASTLIGNPLLEWVGLNSYATGTVTSGYNGSATTIVAIDADGEVVLTASSATNTFVVTNNTTATATGYVTWLGFSTAILDSYNTAVGINALLADNYSATTGTVNTAVGYGALFENTNGSYNTATGYEALGLNKTANGNAAFGYAALGSNTAADNTAIGSGAMQQNTAGTANTASGYQALYTNTTTDYNTASGYQALYSNNGSSNTASGAYALSLNSTGNGNTASGVNALYANKTGNENTASGQGALKSNTTGSSNIAIGFQAGVNLTTGSSNIDIGSLGVAGESGVIRIGATSGATAQSTAYVAGIYGVTTTNTGTEVFVDSSGQLGTVSSSIRYKEDIQPMASASERLLTLRPVKFRYKKANASGEKPIQYGLIAEEVAEVYPELVVRDATTGRIDGVRYDELAPMLLNEVQQQQSKMTAQAERIAAQSEHIAAQDAQIRVLEHRQKQFATQAEVADLKQQLQAALLKLHAADELLGRR